MDFQRTAFATITLLHTLCPLIVAQTDPLCDIGNGCGGPFPPGHVGITPAWWAAGSRDFNVTLDTITADLHVPEPPEVKGLVSIGPALENTNLDDWSDKHQVENTFQTLLQASSLNVCDQTTRQWCAVISYGFLQNATVFDFLPKVALDSSEFLRINFTYEPYNSMFASLGYGAVAQTPSVVGPDSTELLSLPTGPIATPEIDGVPWQIWLKGECDCETRASLPAHRYSNLRITLSSAVPGFASSISSNPDYCNYSTPYTSDGGRTWIIDEIFMSEASCINNSTCQDRA